MTLARLDVRKGGGLAARARRAMARDGAVVLDGLFPRPLLEKLRARVLRLYERGTLRQRGLVRDIAGRFTAVLPFEGPFLDPRFYGNPRLHGMLSSLLGPDYRIGSLETVIALPGAYEQHQHVDGALRFPSPPFAVTLCVPLCDVTEENGPTAIWAGSHKEALKARPASEGAIRRKYREERVTGPLGRCFFFDYRVFHCGMPNETSEPRPVLMFVFCRPWFRDHNLADVSPRVAISRKDLARVPAKRRDLFLLAPAARRALWT